MTENMLIPSERIERVICVLRGTKVIVDTELASLYGVSVKSLNQAVKRNLRRFPGDFMFQLTEEESAFAQSKPETPSQEKRGGRRTCPYAFTEQGVAMLSSVLHGERAEQVNIEIMRAFVRLRSILQSNAELSRKVEQLEKNYDAKFREVFEAIRQLMMPLDDDSKGKLGFQPP
ncbi:MAG: ORF6N domain-containing protein [Planctomycetota bacterium]